MNIAESKKRNNINEAYFKPQKSSQMWPQTHYHWFSFKQISTYGSNYTRQNTPDTPVSGADLCRTWWVARAALTSSDRRGQAFPGRTPRRACRSCVPAAAGSWQRQRGAGGAGLTQTGLTDPTGLRLKANTVRAWMRSSRTQYFLYILVFEKKSWTFFSSLIGIPAHRKTHNLA